METKTTQLEKNTANALDSFDPFANLVMPFRGKKEEAPKQEKKTKIKAQRKAKPQKKPRLDKIVPPQKEDVVQEGFQNPIVESRSREGMPSYRCEFAGQDIFVGFLSYKATNPVTALILTALALDFGRDKIRFDLELGDKRNYDGRNKLVNKFLQTDARWMLMIDDDIIPSIGRPSFLKYWVSAARNVLDMPLQRHIIHKLVGNNKTIVGTAYFNGHENSELVCSDKSLAVRARQYEDAVVKVDWIGAGSMLVHRKVFEDIQKTGSGFFDADESAFFSRAKRAGHETFIDLSIPTFHVGIKAF